MNFSTTVLRRIRRYKVSYLMLCFLILFGICVVYFYSTRIDTPTPQSNNETISENHVLCVLVPYRDRFEDLLEFVPHLSKFLNRQSIAYHIVVVNQFPDGYRFNRGSSFNAGFLISKKKFPECDYIALHDVDTLPLANEVSYAYPGDDAYHGIPPGFHPVRVYSHPDYIGGILLMSNKVFSRMNGFGNNFWGWGFEDIDFRRRMFKYSVQVTRPENLSTDRDNSFKHIHGKFRNRDTIWCLNQALAPNNRDRTDHTGLSDVNFTIASENYLTIEGFPCYVFNIKIKCVFEVTPWCRPLCIDNFPMPKSVWDFEGEFVWPEKWDKDRASNLRTIANSMWWNRPKNQNKNTNSKMSENSLSRGRLAARASHSRKKK